MCVFEGGSEEKQKSVDRPVKKEEGGWGVGSGGGADSGIEASHPPGETTTPQPGNISPYVVWL